MRSRAALLEQFSTEDPILYIGYDIGGTRWKMALTDGEEKIKTKWMAAGDFDERDRWIEWAIDYFDLPAGRVEVVSCYEAGRQGFWIHRCFEADGHHNLVVDPGSLREPKKGRRAKTDRTDAKRLVQELVRWCDGDQSAFSVVNVPSAAYEDERLLFREHNRLKTEQQAHTSRIQSYLCTQGISEHPKVSSPEFVGWLDEAKTADGRPLGACLKAMLEREHRRLLEIVDQLTENEAQRDRYLAGEGRDEVIDQAATLTMLKGIGLKTAFALVVEMYGWRNFQNRKEVGAYLGLDGRRDDSGGSENDGPITKKGNRHVRRIIIQLARNWLNFQRNSQLSRWARRRFPNGKGGVAHPGVVALARKLANRLRVFVHQGEVPHNAVVRPPRLPTMS